MDYFNIVLSICRASMTSPSPALINHIERLAKTLKKNNELDEYTAIRRILDGNSSEKELAPSKVTLSEAMPKLEKLTPSVQPPVDKETSTLLAEIKFPTIESNQYAPSFPKETQSSIASLIEEWEHYEELKSLGVKPALSVMLYGKPGTGKTMLAHHFASTLKLPLVIAKLDGLISSYLGTTARNISSLFKFANRYKCVLLLDEFDAIAKVRDDPQELGEIKRVVNTLLQCIDERSDFGFTIAITNHELLLDPAIWRRFDVRIQTPDPDPSTRLEIINKFNPIEGDPTKLRFIAWLSEGKSGSEIEKLVNFMTRQQIVKKGEYEFFNSINNYLNLSAQEETSPHREIAKGPPEQLALALANDPNLPFNQEQLAMLFGKTQSTISRWIRKESAIS